jgi:hypothetical protein
MVDCSHVEKGELWFDEAPGLAGGTFVGIRRLSSATPLEKRTLLRSRGPGGRNSWPASNGRTTVVGLVHNCADCTWADCHP